LHHLQDQEKPIPVARIARFPEGVQNLLVREDVGVFCTQDLGDCCRQLGILELDGPLTRLLADVDDLRLRSDAPSRPSGDASASSDERCQECPDDLLGHRFGGYGRLPNPER
jgi:hypothetical protein